MRRPNSGTMIALRSPEPRLITSSSVTGPSIFLPRSILKRCFVLGNDLRAGAVQSNSRHMKRFFQLALLALVLVAVAMVSALTAMRLAIHGRQVRVPNVVGMNSAQAR